MRFGSSVNVAYRSMGVVALASVLCTGCATNSPGLEMNPFSAHK